MLENLTLTRIVAHEVLTASQFNKQAPTHSSSLVIMDQEGKNLICQRLNEAIGSSSHCEEMLVSDSSSSSPFQSLAGLLDAKSKEFVTVSASLANRLSEAQTGGSVKEGLGIFLEGTGRKDGQQVRWIAVMKADPDRGLMSESAGGKITFRYVANLIMGAQQRLLKVAFLVEEIRNSASAGHRDPEDFAIKIYDHLLSNSGRGTSALYFYSTFLGLRAADNAAKQCRAFFEETRKFTDELSADAAEKVNYRLHLVSYLRSEKSQISVKDFADSYLPSQHRQAYLKRMKALKLPDHAIRRDIGLIKARLKKQSMRFTSKVLLVGQDDTLRTSVIFDEVVQIDGQEWTPLKIKGRLE